MTEFLLWALAGLVGGLVVGLGLLGLALLVGRRLRWMQPHG
jgi:hypothetical protein